MKRQFLHVISMLLSFVLLVSFVPTAAWAVLAEELTPDHKEFIGYPVADHDGLILEFRNELDLEQHRRSNGGQPLGGNMLLVDGSYQEAKNYEKMTSIRTVTYNYIVEAAGYAEIYGSGRDVQKDDPDLDSDILTFWLAAAEVADSVPNLSLHTTRVAVMDTGIDVVYIRPTFDGGNCLPGNGLPLAKELSLLFVQGNFTLSDKFEILVHPRNQNPLLDELHLRQIRVPPKAFFQPDCANLEYHREHVYGSFLK